MEYTKSALTHLDNAIDKAKKDFQRFTTADTRRAIWHRVDAQIAFAGEMALITPDTCAWLQSSWQQYYPD